MIFYRDTAGLKCRSRVTGHGSHATGHRLHVTGHGSHLASNGLQVTRHRLQVTGHMQVMGKMPIFLYFYPRLLVRAQALKIRDLKILVPKCILRI